MPLVLTACEYVVLDGLLFGMSQGQSAEDLPTTVAIANGAGLVINTSSSAGNQDSDWIIVRDCDFQNCNIAVDDGTGNGIGRVLLDGVDIERTGPYETLYERVAYTEGDPYDVDYGYGITKSSLWDRPGVALTTEALVVFRDSTVRGFHGVSVADSASKPYCKHLDVYGSTFDRHLQMAVNLSETNHFKAVNAAVWSNRMDHGAWAVTLSPISAGPQWIFANYGDGILHNAFKIGIQGPGSGYDTDDANAFKIVANNSFADAGYTTSETIGVPRFQGGHSGVLAYNNVEKSHQHTETSPLGYWFSWMDEPSDLYFPADRVNVWSNGIIFVVNTAANPQKPKQRWDGTTYDVLGGSFPPSDEMVWQDYLIGWSANPSPGDADVDPFPESAAAGLNSAITRKSVYVRGITDLAGDEEGDPVALEDLPIGCFPLRAAE